MKKAKGGEISLSGLRRAIVNFGLVTEWRLESASFFRSDRSISPMRNRPCFCFLFLNILNSLCFFDVFIPIDVFFQMMPHFLCGHLEVRTRLFANDSEETFHLLLVETMLARKIQGGVTLEEHLVEVAK